jgi:hypothetical protein
MEKARLKAILQLPVGQRDHCVMFISLDCEHKLVVLKYLAAGFRINYVSEFVAFKIVLE